jgi:hypothetical protein
LTLLLVSWLLFAPIFLVLRRAVLPRAAGQPAGRHVRSPAHVARALYVSQRILDGAFAHVVQAQNAGAEGSSDQILACLRQGANALLLDLRADVDAWAKATATLGAAPPILPLSTRELRSTELRALAWADGAGHLAVVGPVGRLRLRLAVLRAMLTVFLWKFRRRPQALAIGRELEMARRDLTVLLDEARCGHRALVDASGEAHDGATPLSSVGALRPA